MNNCVANDNNVMNDNYVVADNYAEFLEKVTAVEGEEKEVNYIDNNKFDNDDRTSDYYVWEASCNKKNKRAERVYKNKVAKNVLRKRAIADSNFFDQDKQTQRDQTHTSPYSLKRLGANHKDKVYDKVCKAEKCYAEDKKSLTKIKAKYRGANVEAESVETFPEKEIIDFMEAEFYSDFKEELFGVVRILEFVVENPDMINVEAKDRLKEVISKLNDVI